jgi:hypothetical protein
MKLMPVFGHHQWINLTIALTRSNTQMMAAGRDFTMPGSRVKNP